MREPDRSAVIGPSKEFALPRQPISSSQAPSSPLFSQGVKAGQHIFVSGTTGVDPRTGELVGSSVQLQVRQALVNCRAILEAGGASLDDVVEVGILLADPDEPVGAGAWSRRCFRQRLEEASLAPIAGLG